MCEAREKKGAHINKQNIGVVRGESNVGSLGANLGGEGRQKWRASNVFPTRKARRESEWVSQAAMADE